VTVEAISEATIQVLLAGLAAFRRPVCPSSGECALDRYAANVRLGTTFKFHLAPIH
jgi:hypothetical protein